MFSGLEREAVVRPAAASVAVASVVPAQLGPREARIADAFIEDVIGELARFPNFEVLSARTSLRLSPEELAPERLREAFGVSHLLDCSVRAVDGALTVKASLVVTATGHQVWSQAYDLSLASLRRSEDELAAAVANQLAARIDLARLSRAQAQPAASLDAYDLWLRGREALRRGTCQADLEARELFERALVIDPGYARAYAGLSLSHFNDWSCQHWTQWEDSERLAYAYACRAQALDGGDPLVASVLGRIEIYRRNFAVGRRHLERALALSPNDADLLIQTSWWWSYLGEDERAMAMVEKAFRLNPLHDAGYYIYAFLAFFMARRLEEALVFAETAAPDTIVDQSAYMAATYAHLGRMEPARRALTQFLEVFREKITFGREPGEDEPLSYLLHVNPFTRQADADFLVEGLRKSGLKGRWAGRPYRHDDQAQAARFKPAGGVWEVQYAGRSTIVKDLKGCRDLALLLASPGARLHSLDIAGRVAEGDGGEVMDARARAACQGRIRDLRAALTEAEGNNDLGTATALSEELDALVEGLAAALGLGGRGRPLGDPAEKARTAVTWRIRNAIRRIAAAHPELGRHLRASIRTGAFCSYAPEHPVRWTV